MEQKRPLTGWLARLAEKARNRRYFLLPAVVASGVLIFSLAFLLWSELERVEEYSRIAGRQLSAARTLMALAEAGEVQENQGNLKDLVLDCGYSFYVFSGGLREHVLSPPLAGGMRERLSALMATWVEVQGPLLETSERGKVPPQHRLLVQAETPRLVEEWEALAALLGESRRTLQSWLLAALVAASAWSFLVLSTGAGMAWLYVRRAANLMERAVCRVKENGPAAPAPLAGEDELGALPGIFVGISGTMSRLLALYDQHSQAVAKMLECVPSGILVLSSDQRVLAINHAFRALVRVGDAARGQPLQKILPPGPLLQWITQAAQYQGWPSSFSTEIKEEPGGTLRAALTRIQSRAETGSLLLVAVSRTAEATGEAEAAQFRRLYQKVLENISDGILVVGDDALVRDANDVAAKMFGCARTELASKPLNALAPGKPEDRRLLEEYLQPGRWKLDGSQVEFDFRKKDGTAFPASVRLTECREGDRHVFVLSLRDITENRLADLLARDRLQVIEMIARNQPLDKVLAALTQMVEHQMPGARCVIMLRREDRLYPAAAPSLPESFVRSLVDMPLKPALASCAAAVVEGKPATVADLGSDPNWSEYKDAALHHDLHASWSVPIFSSDGLIVGTIAIYSRQKHELTSAQLELVQMACRLASVCIEQRQLTGQLAYQARHDALTGLSNRISFEDWARQTLAHARRHGQPAGVLSIDLDRFKLVNDKLGHAIGDGLLRQVARRMVGCLRDTDIVARWGGDEFMVGLMELRHREDAQLVAQKLMDALRGPIEVEGHKVTVTVTIGICIFPEDGQDLGELLRNADRAMYRAKNNGRNGFEYYRPELGDAAQHRLELESELAGALYRGELLLHYQPQFDASSGLLVGLEALLRWRHPRLGTVPPARFVPVAEDSGLIIPIGAWVLEEACRQIWDLHQRHPVPVRVAVNVSSLQFARSDFVDFVAHTLHKTGIDPGLLELELTESLVMSNVEESAPRMAQLRKLGVGISIDDFGTGYSSLSYLQRLPINNLKIDQSFVREIGASAKTAPLIESIVSLAHSLGMTATAEGVETTTQLKVLRTTGCHQVQGYLLGPPLPVEKFIPLMTAPAAGARRSNFIVAMPAVQGNGSRPMNGARIIEPRAAGLRLRSGLSVVSDELSWRVPCEPASDPNGKNGSPKKPNGRAGNARPPWELRARTPRPASP